MLLWQMILCGTNENEGLSVVSLSFCVDILEQHLLPNSLTKSMYVSFLAGCFRSVRFGLEEAHG